MQTPDQLAGRQWYTWVPQRIVFWIAGHCARDDISKLLVLVQSRELSAPTEPVPEVLKWFAMPKRRTEVRYGVMVISDTGQITKGEVRLFGSITGEAVTVLSQFLGYS